MELRALSLEDCEQVRMWRNSALCALRTPFMLTKEQQEAFYHDVVCNRDARARYWGIWESDEFIGMCGLENIEWENLRAEISIIIDPERQHKGYGERALHLLLEQGFLYMGLRFIWGECYECNPSIAFWRKMVKKYDAITAVIPMAKYWNGVQYPSLHFMFEMCKFWEVNKVE